MFLLKFSAGKCVDCSCSFAGDKEKWSGRHLVTRI
jgi:hypothetical protein